MATDLTVEMLHQRTPQRPKPVHRRSAGAGRDRADRSARWALAILRN